MDVMINNAVPVELIDLTLALLNLERLYENSLKVKTLKVRVFPLTATSKMFDLGSIVVEGASHSLSIISLLWGGSGFSGRVKYTKSTVDWQSGKSKSPRC